DPALMAHHALNLVDPANWVDAVVTRSDGTEVRIKQYVAPEAEARHFDALEADHSGRFSDYNLEARLGLALDDPSKSTSDLPKAAVEWAQRQLPHADQEHDYSDFRQSSVVTAAMIAMRDGEADLRNEYRDWADGVFDEALHKKEDPSHRVRPG